VTFDGGGPAWEIGLGGVLNLNQYAGQAQYPGTKVMWVIGPNYDQWVALTGHDLRTGAPLWFQIYDTSPDYSTHALLIPHASHRGDMANSMGTWDIWGIGITVMAAGCYELDASWPGSH
jgi:hypothetical protein